MKVRNQLKLKFKELAAYLSEMELLANELPAEFRDVFLDNIKLEIKNELNIAAVKVKNEVNAELNAIVLAEIAKANE